VVKVLNLANAAQVIRERGLRVPEDISLVTFHDADWTSVTTPPITVMDQPVYALG
jgi:LacI family transcriptional regulator